MHKLRAGHCQFDFWGGGGWPRSEGMFILIFVLCRRPDPPLAAAALGLRPSIIDSAVASHVSAVPDRRSWTMESTETCNGGQRTL